MSSDIMTFEDLRKMVDEIYEKSMKQNEPAPKDKVKQPVSIRKKITDKLNKRVERLEE